MSVRIVLQITAKVLGGSAPASGSVANTACGHCIAGYGVGSSGLGTAGSLGRTCEKCAFPEYNDVISNSACANMACPLGEGIVSNPRPIGRP